MLILTLHFNYHPRAGASRHDNLSVGSSAPVEFAGGYRPGNRTFLEMDSMVASWWIMDFFLPSEECTAR